MTREKKLSISITACITDIFLGHQFLEAPFSYTWISIIFENVSQAVW